MELQVAGRTVVVTHPERVVFPRAGLTKLDLVNYYVAVADGALRGVGARPMALKRFVDGAEGQGFFQKRAPTSRPDWIEIVTLAFPSGRTADEIVVRDAAQLAWIINLGCIDLNPHPVRADDLEHPDELRIDLDPVPGVAWSQIREVALVVREALEAVGLVGWPKTSGSRGIHINVRIERRWEFQEVRRAALAIARDVERRAPTLATSKWWKEERHGVFLDYNQNAKDRTVASAYSVRPLPDARVSMPITWSELPDVVAEDFTVATVPALFAARGDAGKGIDEAVGSLDALLELARRHEAEGQGDAPWPPHYQRGADEPRRVAPSRARKGDAPSRRKKSAAVDGDSTAPAQDENSTANAEGDAATRTEKRGRPPWARKESTGDGATRRKPVFPLIVIGRAQLKEDALAGLERWKARHPEVAALLEPADVMVDQMRGRSTTWTRIRINLRHVPEALRPAEEPLDPDFDLSTAR